MKSVLLERLYDPLSVLPCVVVFGVLRQNCFSEKFFFRRVFKPLDKYFTVVPHLVILRLFQYHLLNEVEFVVEILVKSF